jgi:hypothetical protein
MEQTEIDEVSDAFTDAWKDYFGDVMYAVKLLATPAADAIYKEQKQKAFDYDNKILFHGILKQTAVEGELHQGGHRVEFKGTITAVTKELIDNGINVLEPTMRIYYIDRFGTEHLYRSVDILTKVQLCNNRIFTSVGVVEE